MPQPSNSEYDALRLDLARLSFIALLQTGRMTARLSNGLLALTGVSALLLILNANNEASHFLTVSSVKVSLILLMISTMFGVLQHYAATRIMLDLEIFLSLRGKLGPLRDQGTVAGDASGNVQVSEQVLAAAVQSLKESSPAFLIAQSIDDKAKSDPLHSYKQSAKLYYRQAMYTVSQIAGYLGFILFMVSR
jgi:hypothetical protein